MPFEFERLEIPDVILVKGQAFEDHRGYFMESYKRSEFEAGGVPWGFVQDNFSHSRQGVLRGLHYQMDPEAQGKLICVLRGEIFDVAVDLRKGSPSYGHWVGVRLSSGERKLVYVPAGFAHGFQVLSTEADVLYKVTKEYAPAADRGIRWNDRDLAIPWPIQEPVLSPKDSGLPPLHQAENNFTYEGTRG